MDNTLPPLKRIAARLAKSGSAVAGFSGADAIRRSNCVILTDGDLFPPGTVTLGGLKGFGEESGKVMEPMERVVIDVPETYQGNVMTALGARKAILMNMQMMNNRSRLEFRMPSRGLFGYRSQFLTDTHGEGIMNTIFDGYEEWCGPIATRSSGSLISFDTGDAVTYGLFNAQQRGTLIVTAGEKVYEGEVVGYTPTGEDITVNVCKTKHLTNTRASGSDDALRLIPVTKFSLEGCLEFLAPDELLEVTPENLRIRKRILDHDLRMKATSKKSKG